MTTLTEIAPEKKGKEFVARLGWLVLICATLYVCYFQHLGAIGFVGPDEPRYAWIARAMAQSGDWVTPRLYGKPWFEKPPLYYWGAALSFKLFGESEAAARLPSAVSALLATLALAWLAWQIYGVVTARWLLLLLPTTVAMIGFSHAAATDMPFAGPLTVAMVCAAILVKLLPSLPIERPQHSLDSAPDRAAPLRRNGDTTMQSWVAILLFGVFLGLAVLAKGPAALILCGGAVFFWALFTQRWRDAFRLLHPVGIAAFCFIALPWYILCARRNPDFFRVFIIEHNFKRYLTPEFQHIQPWWYYLPIVLAALLPWTLFLLPAIGASRQSLKNRLNSGAAAIFLATWSLFPCLFFTFSKSKLPGYILPAIPPLILLCADAIRRLFTEKTRFARTVLGYTCLVALLMMIASFAYTIRLRGPHRLLDVARNTPIILAIFGLVVLLGLLAMLVILPRRPAVGMLCIVAALLISLGSANLSTVDSAVSSRQTGQALAKLTGNEEVLLCQLPRSYVYGFNFYLGREIPEWSQHDPRKRAVVVIGSPACWSELQGVSYSLRSDMAFARWPIVEIEPTVSGRSSP